MSSLIRILILEDMPEDVGLVERVLRKDGLQFDTKQVDTREEFVQAMESFTPDIILSDHSLPQFNSFEALKICKAQPRKIPFILVTGTVSEEFAVSCLKAGADDYVLKSNLSRLPSAIRTSIKHHDMEDKKEKADVDIRKQNTELIKINRELDTFVYNASHNLRSPLASVLGLINLAKVEDFHTNPLSEYLAMMESSIQKLDMTLKEIIDYSHNNRKEISVCQVDLEQLAHKCFDQLSYLVAQKEVVIGVKVVGAIPFYTDAHRLSVLLNNLFSNSIRYLDKTKPVRRIDVSATISANSATIQIEDNGIGIQNQFLPKVFDMFFRASEQSEGAGLGLYITREIISVLNGKISIASQPGVGTSVAMVIPNLLP